MDLFYRPKPEPKPEPEPDLIARLIKLAAPKIPSMRQLSPHRYDSECYEVANAVANQWPHLQQDSGFYVHPKRGPGDHGWNIAPDGTIVDMTAVQHDYDGLASEEGWDEEKAPAPKHPEIIPPDHPFYPRYVSWTRHEVPAQEIAHRMGYHNTQMDKVESCPICYPQKTASEEYNEDYEDYPDDWNEGEIEEWPDPPSQVPKYQAGDEVVIYGGKPGVVVGEPEKFEGDWWYRVKDNESGQVSTGPEHLFTRPESYDQPGVTGIDDWFPKQSAEDDFVPPVGSIWTMSDPWSETKNPPGPPQRTVQVMDIEASYVWYKDLDTQTGLDQADGMSVGNWNSKMHRGIIRQKDPDWSFGETPEEAAEHWPSTMPDDWKLGSAPTEPPNYRKQVKSNESCGLCKMMFEGKCWGYGNKPVEPDMVCDSFAPETKKESKVGDHYCAYPNCGQEATQWPNLRPEGPAQYTGMCDKHAEKYQSGKKKAPKWIRNSTDEWSEMLSDKPAANPVAFPFIYLPKQGIFWGGPNSGHDRIEIELTGAPNTIPQPAVYGRWYDDDRIEIYDTLPWNEQEKLEALVRLNAPGRKL